MRTYLLLLIVLLSFVFSAGDIYAATPTIHSIPGYGNWNDPASWSEGRIPTSDDIVEINGIVNLDVNPIIAGIIIHDGGTLSGPYRSLTVSGNIENHGIWDVESTIFGGDISLIGSLTLGGNISLGDHIIAISNGESITVSGQISGSGTFIGDNISLNTYGNINTMNLYGSGLDLHIYGPQTKIAETNIFTKNVTLHSGAVLIYYTSFGSPSWANYSINTNTFLIQSGASIDQVHGTVNIHGNLINNGNVDGSIDVFMYLYGDFINNGSWSMYNIYFSGSDIQNISGNLINGHTTLNADLTISGSVIFGKDINFNNHSITLDSGKSLTVSGAIYGSGTFIGDNIYLNTYGDINTVNLYGSGLDLHIYGPQTRIQETNINTKNVTLHSGALLTYYTSFGSPSWANYSINTNTFLIQSGASINEVYGYVNIHGNLINEGYVDGSIYVSTNLYGDFTNNGSWSMYRTYASWLPVAGATSYTIQFDPGTSTGFTTTSTSYDISDKIAGSYYYTVTPDNSGPYTRKCINSINCINTGGNNPPIAQPISLPILPTDLINAIYPREITSAITVNVKENTQMNTPSKDALDPVDLATGNFTYSNTLMHLVGNTLDYDFGINYQSQIEYSGALGYNWDFTDNKKLVPNADGSVTYSDGKLHKFTFVKSGDTYLPLKGINATLIRTGSGNFAIDFINGDHYVFDSSNLISSIENQYGAKLVFSYTGSQLTQAIDSVGRIINYTYNSLGKLETIEESGGKNVAISYYVDGDTNGNISDLKSITIGDTHTTDHKVIDFTYSKHTDPKLAHNILTMTDSKGAIYVTNTYDSNDRVLTQKYGDHTGSYEYATQDIHADDTILTIGTGAVIGNYVVKNKAHDRSGNITDYIYNRMGNVTERTSSGITTKYNYDSLGQLTTEILPKGNGTVYSYDSLGNKIEIRKKSDMTQVDNDATDIVTKMTYTGAINTLESITDPMGNITTFESDTKGNIIKITKHATTNTPESVESFVYNLNGHLISQTDARGNITTYEYNQIGKPIKITKAKNTPDETITSYIYDSYGNPLTEVDGQGNTKAITYDAFDRLVSSISSEGIKTQYLYDANNNKTRTTLELGPSETVITDTVYNLLDKPTSVTADIDATHRASISYSYDADDRILDTTYPNGQKEKSTYDTLGRLIKKEIIGSTTRTMSYTYDTNGNVLSENINGLATTFSYDEFDRLISSVDALGSITQIQYNKSGNILESIVKNQAGTILKKTITEYDRDNRPTKITEYGDGSSKRITTRAYDTNGNTISQIDPSGNITTSTYDSLNRPKTTTLANGLTTTNIYDKNSNIVEQRITGGSTILTTQSTYDRDNRKISTTDASGNTTTYEYNQLNQITRSVDPKGIATSYTYDYRGKVKTETRAGKTILKTYDLMGNLVNLTDANNNTTSYTHNGNNELASETLPDNKKTIYTYDTRGNIATKTDPNGTITTYTYDLLNRITRKDYTLGQGVGGTTYETYTYDALGRLVNSTDSNNQTLSFTYDLLGNLTSETNSNKTIQYTYDSNNNKLTTLTPSNKTISNTYDPMNRITSVKRDTANMASYTYNSLNLTRETLANGIQTNYAYDSGNRMNQIGNDTISYDPNSNITRKGADTYLYDSLNQLTQAKYTDKRYGTMEGNGYNYDLMGNRQSEENLRWVTKTTRTGAIITTEKKKVWNYTTNTLNQYQDIIFQSGATSTGITSTGTTTGTGQIGSGETSTGEIETDTGMTLAGRLLYDNNGNLIGNILNLKRQYEYTYDANNRLIEISRYNETTGKEIIIQMTYDSLSRCTTKQVQNQKTEYIYEGNNIIEETLSTVNPTTGAKTKKEIREYVYGARGMDDIITITITPYIRLNRIDVPGTSNTYYYEKDHLGSITRITSSTGSIIDEYSYTVFGKPYKKDTLGVYKPISSLKSSINNTRLYTGREYDREINLYYLRARYYDANMGRFISRDPIGTRDNVNLYTYVGNSPLGYTDRTGLAKLILGAIHNAKSIAIDLVGRRLDFGNDYFPIGKVGVHSFIEFTIMDNFGNVNSYSVGGNNINHKLDALFNEPTDVGWTGTKTYQAITTPDGMTDKEFATNIINESLFYDDNQKDYALFSADDGYDSEGNCHNFATTILMGASNYSPQILSTVTNFDPPGANPGFGEYFVPVCTK